jgi:uncharacterized protein (DUF2062 family)
MAEPAPPTQTDTPQPPSKRRFFQIHLSTAVVLMFVAGGLMWANLVPHRTECGTGPIGSTHLSDCGFPMTNALHCTHMLRHGAEGQCVESTSFLVRWFPMACNVVCALLLCAVIGLPMEYWLCKREGNAVQGPRCLQFRLISLVVVLLGGSAWTTVNVAQDGWPFRKGDVPQCALVADALIGSALLVILFCGVEWWARRRRSTETQAPLTRERQQP